MYIIVHDTESGEEVYASETRFSDKNRFYAFSETNPAEYDDFELTIFNYRDKALEKMQEIREYGGLSVYIRKVNIEG